MASIVTAVTTKDLPNPMDASGRRFTIVVARWNELVTEALLEGALDELQRYGAAEVEILRVPGTWELPLAVVLRLGQPPKPDAILALGCILQGATAHAQLLAGDVGAALMRLQLEHALPISWGILTPENQEQALDRAGLKMGNKGREAALAAIEMLTLSGRLSGPVREV